MELDNVWFSGRPDGGTWVNAEPTPDQVTVRIAYDAPDGTRYEDEFPLDVQLLRQRTYTTSSRSPERQAEEALKALEGIERALKQLAK
jgi:hypothetical protein